MCFIIDGQRAHFKCFLGFKLGFLVQGEWWGHVLSLRGLFAADGGTDLVDNVLLVRRNWAEISRSRMKLCYHNIYLIQPHNSVDGEVIWHELPDRGEFFWFFWLLQLLRLWRLLLILLLFSLVL